MYRPTEQRLLDGMRHKVRALSEQISDKPQRESLDVVEMVLTEILKRKDRRFYVRVYAAGYSLAGKGLELAPQGANRSWATSALGEMPAETDASGDAELMDERLRVLCDVLERLVDDVATSRSDAANAWLDLVVNWEADLHSGGEAKGAPVSGPAGIRVTRERLERYLKAKFPDWGNIQVIGVKNIPGGFAKATFELELQDSKHGRRLLILRADQPLTIFHMDGAVVDKEFSVVQVAFHSGLPVAEPLWLEDDPDALGARFFVSKKAAGTNFGDVMGATTTLSEELIKDLVRVLAKIHATELRSDDPHLARSHLGKWLQYPSLAELVPEYVRYWQAIARKCDFGSSPTLTRAFHWLLQNVPRNSEKPRLVHGDYGLHNVLLLDDKVSAVLDWEASYVGDPADEFFMFSQALGKQVDQTQLMKWYRDAGGVPMSDYRLRYFEVLSCLKGPITGYGSLSLIGRNPSADLKVTTVGYRFVTRFLKSINDRIAAAEAAKGSA